MIGGRGITAQGATVIDIGMDIIPEEGITDVHIGITGDIAND